MRSSVTKRVVVVEGMSLSLSVNIPDWSKREGTGTWRRERELESEREEKREYKTIKILQHLSVPLQICNGTVAMLYNF